MLSLDKFDRLLFAHHFAPFALEVGNDRSVSVIGCPFEGGVAIVPSLVDDGFPFLN